MNPTNQANSLVVALEKKGIKIKPEHSDGHKHVDIFIPEASIYIEVDGLQHFTNPDQIIADFKRNYYSFKDGFFTLHITNQLIETHLEEIANAIEKVVVIRKKELFD